MFSKTTTDNTKSWWIKGSTPPTILRNHYTFESIGVLVALDQCGQIVYSKVKVGTIGLKELM